MVQLRSVMAAVAMVSAFLIMARCTESGDKESLNNDDDSTTQQGDGTTVEPGSCLSGVGGAASISVGQAVAGAPRVGAAQNTMDDDVSALPGTPSGLLAVGPCGKMGALMRNVTAEGGVGPMSYVEVGPEGLGQPHDLPTFVNAVQPSTSLLYDADCTPLVVWVSSATTIGTLIESSPSSWDTESTVDVAEALGAAPGMLQHKTAYVDGSGKLRFMAVATVGGVTKLLAGIREQAKGSVWQLDSIDAPPDVSELGSFIVGDDGTWHVLYTKTEFPCDPCDLGLYYASAPALVEAPGSVSQPEWAEEVVQESAWGAPDDRFARDAVLAMSYTGQPIVAANYQTRVITGSLKTAELRVYTRQAGKWCSETVSSKSDGYAGEDGDRFTGATPAMAVDTLGRVHVVFGDLTQWHDTTNYSNGIQGQLRYAVRTGDGWSLKTLFKQPGQNESAKPLHGFVKPMVAVSADGTKVLTGGDERVWETDSIYNTTSLPMTFTFTLIPVELSY